MYRFTPDEVDHERAHHQAVIQGADNLDVKRIGNLGGRRPRTRRRVAQTGRLGSSPLVVGGVVPVDLAEGHKPLDRGVRRSAHEHSGN
ncbi:hypothetical protein EXE46_00390 [Halorubrum sp. GN11_10-6_MGM]|nr:hypothetical protein EXE46_00390 [Halorubrum sp. GN11_10-6_MGM]